MNKYKRMCVIAGRPKKENDRLKGRPVNLYKEQRLARMEERKSKKEGKVKELIEDGVNSRVSRITSQIWKSLQAELSAPYEKEIERLQNRVKDLWELTQKLMRGQGVKPPAQKDMNPDNQSLRFI